MSSRSVDPPTDRSREDDVVARQRASAGLQAAGGPPGGLHEDAGGPETGRHAGARR